jgi:hypothetical protein
MKDAETLDLVHEVQALIGSVATTEERVLPKGRKLLLTQCDHGMAARQVAQFERAVLRACFCNNLGGTL